MFLVWYYIDEGIGGGSPNPIDNGPSLLFDNNYDGIIQKIKNSFLQTSFIEKNQLICTASDYLIYTHVGKIDPKQFLEIEEEFNRKTNAINNKNSSVSTIYYNNYHKYLAYYDYDDTYFDFIGKNYKYEEDYNSYYDRKYYDYYDAIYGIETGFNMDKLRKNISKPYVHISNFCNIKSFDEFETHTTNWNLYELKQSFDPLSVFTENYIRTYCTKY